MRFSDDFRRLGRAAWGVGVLVAGWIGFGWLGETWLVEPVRERLAQQQNRRNELLDELTKARAVAPRLEELRIEIAKVVAENEKLDRIMPPVERLGKEWNDAIPQRARRAQIRLTELTFSPPEAKDFYSVVAFHMRLGGSLEPLAEFVRGVAAKVPMTAVTAFDFALQPSGDWQARIHGQIFGAVMPGVARSSPSLGEEEESNSRGAAGISAFAVVAWRLLRHRRRIDSAKERLVRRLALAAACGAPLAVALRGARKELAAGISWWRRRELDRLIADLEAGTPLASALAAQPRRFAEWEVAWARSAESSIRPGARLLDWAAALARARLGRERLLALTITPIVLGGFAAVIISILEWKVLPTLLAFSHALAVPIAAPQRWVSQSSYWLAIAAPWLVWLAAIGGVAWLLLRRQPELRQASDWLLLALPVFGSLARAEGRVRAFQALASEVGDGRSLDRALGTAADLQRNQSLGASLRKLADRVASGEPWRRHLPIDRLGGSFGWDVAAALDGRDSAGTLRFLARAESDRFERLLVATVGWLEPTVVLVMGAVIGLAVAACYLTMFATSAGLSL